MPFFKYREDLVSDFLGLPRSQNQGFKRAPATIHSLMVLLRERYNLEHPSPERSLVDNWETIFGKFAGRCNPLRIKDESILIISVTNQTLRAELRFQKNSLLKKIQKLEHCEGIKDLVIRS